MANENRTCIALDIGSSSIKAAVARDGVWLSSRRWATPAPLENTRAGRHETDADVLVAAVRTAIDEVSAEYAGAITSIGFSTQMHGVVVTDEHDQPLSPLISWQDNRALEEVPGGGSHLDSVRRRASPELFERTGLTARAGLGAINALCWLEANPALASTAARVHTIGSFVLSALTGEYCTHVTNAAALGIMDLATGGWHTDLIRALGLDGLELPRIEHGFTPVGTVMSHGGALAVHPDVGDHQASVYGSRRDDSGTVSISVGTAGIAARTTRHVVPNPRYEVRPYIGGGYLNTVTRLPGGRHFDAVLGLLQATGRDVFGVTDAWAGLRTWVADTMARPGAVAGLTGATKVRDDIGGAQLAISLPLGTEVSAEDVLQATLGHFGDRYRDAVAHLFSADDAPERGALNGGMAVENEWLPEFFATQLGVPFAWVDGQDLALTGLVRLLHETGPAGPARGDETEHD